MTVEELEARLNKQAAAIRDLRRRVTALEDAAGATDSTEPLTSTTREPSRGVYVPRGDCVMCGKDKSGRTALTCKPCGITYQSGIRGEVERVMFTTCGNCGEAKGANTKMLCDPCSKSFRTWKTGVQA